VSGFLSPQEGNNNATYKKVKQEIIIGILRGQYWAARSQTIS